MAILKKLLLIFLLPLTLFSKNYTYLVDKYSKETELEAKIVTKIAKDILSSTKIKLFIPHIKTLDKEVYSKNITLVDRCEDANFVFIKYESLEKCKKDDNFILTNNYRKLMSDKNYLGAFFWSKSRPNIVLIKDRLIQKNINLPKEYNQFIEDIQ